ncbi:MAG: amidohydrolase [Acidobacteriales bacterium]|nr:amidohydrolase [Terriglobales bacterium]
MKIAIAFLLATLIASSSFAQSAPEHSLAITHVTIIDVNGGPARRDMTVVVLDGRIMSIGPSKAMRMSANIRTVDASGKFLIPGLWDMNVYLDTDEAEKSRLADFVANGITEVRIISGGAQLQQWNKDIETGKLLGPRMMIEGAEFDESEKHPVNAVPAALQSRHNWHEELRMLVQSGSTPLEALQSATVNAAKFFNKSDSMGSIAKWKFADMIVLDANPLDDIRNTTRISAVVIRGKLLDRKQLDAMLDEVKTAEQAKSEMHR